MESGKEVILVVSERWSDWEETWITCGEGLAKKGFEGYL